MPGRNESCPCGSGRRYKHCCGAIKEPTPSFQVSSTVSITTPPQKKSWLKVGLTVGILIGAVSAVLLPNDIVQGSNATNLTPVVQPTTVVSAATSHNEFVLTNLSAKTNLQSAKYPNQPGTETLESIKIINNQDNKTLRLVYNHRNFHKSENDVTIKVTDQGGRLVGSETQVKVDNTTPGSYLYNRGTYTVKTEVTYSIEFNPSTKDLYLQRILVSYYNDKKISKETIVVGEPAKKSIAKTEKFEKVSTELTAEAKSDLEAKNNKFWDDVAETVWSMGRLGYSRSSMLRKFEGNPAYKAVIDLYWILGDKTAEYYTKAEFVSLVRKARNASRSS